MNFREANKYPFFRFELEKVFLISLGAIPGALIRWQLNNDLLLNILGAGILGFLLGCGFKLRIKLIFGIGFCGALTTFSSWITDCLDLLVNGYFFNAIFLIFISLFFGLVAAFFGLWLGGKIKA
tara:strand:+ start:3867 stop:4238 length:372 start_codon:yes stop_codon:yes gene_type:complete